MSAVFSFKSSIQLIIKCIQVCPQNKKKLTVKDDVS